MPGEPIQVGPFRGGLNTFSDESAIADNELIVCNNFDPDIDGSLKSRPPAVESGNPMTLDTASGHPKLVAAVRTATGSEIIIGTDGVDKTYYFDGTDWNTVTTTFAATAAAEYNGVIWLVSPPSSANPGGYWTIGGGFTADANMPHGGDIVEFKSRLWVVRGKDATTQGTRLFFSKALGQPDFWPAAPNFIEIGVGDGENIVAISTYFNMLVLWRTDSIYRFTYTSDPANGDVAVLIPGIGLESRESLASYESYFYFMYRGRAYEFINNRANHINQIVSFRPSTSSSIVEPFAVSVIGQRIIFQWFEVSYVFHLRTKTWTTWTTTEHGSFGKWLPRPATVEGIDEAVCFSSSTIPFGSGREATLLSMMDIHNSRSEEMVSEMETKTYDYESATLLKRIFFWTISAAWNGLIRATQSRINFTDHPTWGIIRQQHTWGSLQQTTWGTLSSDHILDTIERVSTGIGPQRKEAKVGRSGRFKRISFRVEAENDGSSATAPVRLFYLTTYVRAGQVISKDVS